MQSMQVELNNKDIKWAIVYNEISPKFLLLQSATNFIFFLAAAALPEKVTCLTDGDSCNCIDDFVFVGNFAIPFINIALLPVSKSRTTKYLESSWHLFTKLTSAIISLPEPNSQENIPSDLAVVPIKVIKIKISSLIKAPNVCFRIDNKANHSMFLL
jgi:hypothetical protein